MTKEGERWWWCGMVCLCLSDGGVGTKHDRSQITSVQQCTGGTRWPKLVAIMLHVVL